MIDAIRHLLHDLRAARALRVLHEAKRAGRLDWYFAHGSWCSDLDLIVVVTRNKKPGVMRSPLGKPITGYMLDDVLSRAVGQINEAARKEG